ncbi:hypothetical protein AB0K16_34040 [Nonomuraea jabiensis]|uniref:hypothetical protein n=1 Tax=Nonomuraea jabiensis TaxID=882448 RepID=UPI003425788C
MPEPAGMPEPGSLDGGPCVRPGRDAQPDALGDERGQCGQDPDAEQLGGAGQATAAVNEPAR